ncbi:hypothetical protein ABIB57_004810 [Devosia sp. UYZn731]|uniref:hypothetical protein n=1 Tax=Devosia sp. UYZn731 TaxID=3156345 RepID=UPI003396FCBA
MMLKYLLALSLVSVLAACSGYNINRVQFSGETIPFPENYQQEAARVVALNGGTISTAKVSRPQETIGESPFGPKRWYSCISGTTEPEKSGNWPNVENLVRGLVGVNDGIYNRVMFFSAQSRRPSVKSGFDSDLCKRAIFEPITAAPPS